LKPLERDFDIDIWDDRKIKPGSKWREEIEKAVTAAKVAILLISADFLASDFINNDELPPLLEAAEKEGAIILPVIVSPSRFLRTQSLSQFQSVNAPTNSLIKMARGEQEEVFVEITEYIETALGPLKKSEGEVQSSGDEPIIVLGETNQEVLNRVPLIVYFNSISGESANEIYSILQSKGMSPKGFGDKRGVAGPKTIVYSLGYEETAYWLRENVNKFKDFKVTKIGPRDSYKGIIINLW
jgi:hypothetical protein